MQLLGHFTGVGGGRAQFAPDLAQSVVDYRDRFGPLASLTELTSVLGMSKSDYALAKKALTLG